MRLAKYLAHAGVASRRGAEALVVVGRVRVDGELARDPARDVGEDNRVEVDGRVLAGPEQPVVYALHKPVGVLSTAHDPHGRPTVVQSVPDSRRLYPVGRLDADSSGLILLTNDGALANRLTHPRYEVPKTYRVCVAGAPVAEDTLRTLRGGVLLDDGPTAPARAWRCGPSLRSGAPAGEAGDVFEERAGARGGVRRAGGHSRPVGPGGFGARGGASVGGPPRARDRAATEELELTIREGRNRQVRRMCEAVGHPVVALQRVAFGSLRLGDLAPGEYRRLAAHELRALSAARGTL